jgi:hypothetical protein
MAALLRWMHDAKPWQVSPAERIVIPARSVLSTGFGARDENLTVGARLLAINRND